MKKNSSPHKVFTQDMIAWLMLRAREERVATGRLSRRTLESPESKEEGSPKPANKKQKVKESKWAINELSNRFPSRFLTPRELHARTSVGRGTCVYCSASYQDRKKKGEKNLRFDEETKRTFLHCAFCTLTSADKSTAFLCKAHFDDFHSK